MLSMKQFLYIFGQLTWGVLQSLAGFLIFLKNIKCTHRFFYGSICTYWKLKASLSLGLFIFISDDPFFYYEHERCHYSEEEFSEMMAVHEYGHTIQSLIWGPLYLLTVGAPSMIWAKLPHFEGIREKQNISYFDTYPENQANMLGEKVTGLKSPRMLI